MIPISASRLMGAATIGSSAARRTPHPFGASSSSSVAASANLGVV